MIDIFATAVPGSNVSNAEIAIEGKGFRTALTVNAGTQARANVFPLDPRGITDIELSVRSTNRQCTVYAANIPVDATITIFGLDALRFEGQIIHKHAPATAVVPTCSLKCTPHDKPQQGPGCKECDAQGLIFKVCC